MQEPRFIVDVNVGRLAKWLRVMGYDALFPSDMEDNNLVRIALREDRIIVTKDTGLTERRLVTTGRLKVVLIQHDDLKSQLQQVIRSLNLNSHREFSRCIRCNEPMENLSRESVKEQIPPYVYETQNEFMECPLCRRIYWRGTHWANMHRELAQLQACPEHSRRDGER